MSKKSLASYPIEPDGPDVPLVLAAKDSRVASAIGMAFMALIWNGISWTITYVVLIKEFSIVPFLFMSLFCLIGLVLLAGAVYAFLQLFNPRPNLICSQTNIYPGTEFEISWVQKGNSTAIKKLSILVEGVEEVSYRQGTSTRKEKSIFFKHALIETTDQTEIAEGYRMMTIPAETMHSFTSKNNSIVWHIRVEGAIPYWPDIADTFQLSVYPPVLTDH